VIGEAMLVVAVFLHGWPPIKRLCAVRYHHLSPAAITFVGGLAGSE
jgi:hypothetical protein